MDNQFSFRNSLKLLNIEDYLERIVNSNSHGGLTHLVDYMFIAAACENPSEFREEFEGIVKTAEKTWKRPESVFQHIPKLLKAKPKSSVAPDTERN